MQHMFLWAWSWDFLTLKILKYSENNGVQYLTIDSRNHETFAQIIKNTFEDYDD